MEASESGEGGNPGTLGMTILFGNAKYSFQDELSSRPERSVAEGSAVRPAGFPNSGALTQTLKAVPSNSPGRSNRQLSLSFVVSRTSAFLWRAFASPNAASGQRQFWLCPRER